MPYRLTSFRHLPMYRLSLLTGFCGIGYTLLDASQEVIFICLVLNFPTVPQSEAQP